MHIKVPGQVNNMSHLYRETHNWEHSFSPQPEMSLFFSCTEKKRKSINILITEAERIEKEISWSNLNAKKPHHIHTQNETRFPAYPLCPSPQCLCLSYVLYTCFMIFISFSYSVKEIFSFFQFFFLLTFWVLPRKKTIMEVICCYDFLMKTSCLIKPCVTCSMKTYGASKRFLSPRAHFCILCFQKEVFCSTNMKHFFFHDFPFSLPLEHKVMSNKLNVSRWKWN